MSNRNGAQSIPARKKRENAGNNPDADSVSSISSRDLAAEKEHEELDALRVQLEDLQRKLLEKDELLKSSEISKKEVSSVQAKLEEVKRQAAEKDSLIKASQLQLSDAKVYMQFLQWNRIGGGLPVFLALLDTQVTLFANVLLTYVFWHRSSLQTSKLLLKSYSGKL